MDPSLIVEKLKATWIAIQQGNPSAIPDPILAAGLALAVLSLLGAAVRAVVKRKPTG